MRIILHRNFKKQIKKFSRSIQEAYKIRRDLFLEDPFHPTLENHQLQGKYAGFRSINITGDIRVIYDPVEEGVAHFITIGTHSELYG